MTGRAKVLTLVVLVAVGAGVFYLHLLSSRLKNQNAQRVEESARTQLAEASLQSEKGPQQVVTLYFPSNDQGVLIQETRQLTLASSPADRIRQIFLALLEGSEQGQNRPLPPGAELRAAFLASDGTAYLDLATGSLPSFNPGIGSETLAVYSIVDSICANIPEAKRVRFLIDGQEADTLNGHVDLTQAFAPDPNLSLSGP